MVQIISCDHLPAIIEMDICALKALKWQMTLIACSLLFIINIYLLRKWKYRCYKTLLTFHNLRASLILLLSIINTLELMRTFLPLPIAMKSSKAMSGQNTNNTLSMRQRAHMVVLTIGWSNTWNALTAIMLTIMLLWHHRVIELKNRVCFLYMSGAVCCILFMIRLLNMAEIFNDNSMWDLEPFLECSSALCLAALCLTDVFTVYKERYRPDYFEDYDKIGYKHTLATFYSKMVFWWLNPLLLFGYREPLELEDLGEMRLEDSARAHYDRFLLIYKTAKVKNNEQPPSLWLCYLKNSWRMFTLGGLLKLFGDLFALFGPLAIQQIVQYIDILYNNNNNNTRITMNSNAIGFGANAENESFNLDQNYEIRYRNDMNAPSIQDAISGARAKAARADIYQWLTLSPRRMQAVVWAAAKLNVIGLTQNLTAGHVDDGYTATTATAIDTYLHPYTHNNRHLHAVGSNIISTSIDNGGVHVRGGDFIRPDSINGSDVRPDLQIYYANWFDLLSNGWAIAWLVLLAALAQGALSQASTHILNMTGIRIKTSLQGLIYRKTLLLHASCIANVHDDDDNDNDDGDDDADEAHKRDNANATCATNRTTTTTTTSTTKAETTVVATPTTTALINSAVMATNADAISAVGIAGADVDVKQPNAISSATKRALNTQQDKGMANQQQQQHQQQQQTQHSANAHLNDFNTVGAITNLMTEDTTNIMSFFWIAHYIWAIPLKITVVIYLLYLKLGISAVIGSIVCILTMTPLQFLIGKAMSTNMDVLAKYTDERLKCIYDVFIGIKTVKLNAWDDVFIRRINAARTMELKYLNKDSVYWTLMTIITHISTVLITCVTLDVYVGRNEAALSASHLFSALALFQQLTVPLLIFPITVPIIIAAVISTKRMETFLQAPEIQKHFEGIRNMARILSKSDASLDMYEHYNELTTASTSTTLERVDEKLHEQQYDISRLNINVKNIGECVIEAPLASSEPHTPLASSADMQQPQFPCDAIKPSATNANEHTSVLNSRKSQKGHKELLRNSPYVLVRPRKVPSGISGALNNWNAASVLPRKYESWHRDSVLLKMPENVAVSVRDGIFAWHSNIWQFKKQTSGDYSLHIPELLVPRGRLTMILGKNGSGKSSLLAGLLMEMPLTSGDMVWMRTSTIAYVPQQPWLLNASIRENILFGESYRQKRYEYVLSACALKPDIAVMPSADETLIGERGLNLSGGQRQRIAIARALYSSANVVIMDDPFASLDNEVANHIFEQGIKIMLLNANRTVILVTQQLKLASQAHYLIVLKDGRLQAVGSYKDIEVKHSHIIAKWNSIVTTAAAGVVATSVMIGNGNDASPTNVVATDNATSLQQQQQTHCNMSASDGGTKSEQRQLFGSIRKLCFQRSISLIETPNTNTTTNTITATTTSTTATPTNTAAAHAGDDEFKSKTHIDLGDPESALMDTDDIDDLLPLCATSQNAFGVVGGGSASLSNFPATFTRKRASVYGSRHLIYDVPLPIDEYQTEEVIMRRTRRRRGSSMRSSTSTHSNESSSVAATAAAVTADQKNIKQQKKSQQQQQQQQHHHQQRRRSSARPNSSISNNRLSGISVASSSLFDVQQNVSTTPYDHRIKSNSKNNNNDNSNNFVAIQQQRALSWQPMGKQGNKLLTHQAVTRHTSLPGSLQQQLSCTEHERKPATVDASLKVSSDDAVAAAAAAGRSMVGQVETGFQKFLRRMSMRALHNPAGTTAAGIAPANSATAITTTTPTAAAATATSTPKHRPASATNSILSLSDETSTVTTTTTTKSILPMNMEIEEEDEEAVEAEEKSVPDNGICCAETENRNNEEVQQHLITGYNKASTNGTESTAPTTLATTTTATTNQAIAQVMDADERKYGKIPMYIYWLYVRASRVANVAIFFAMALIWQCLRVYTDVWLQQWTNDTPARSHVANVTNMRTTTKATSITTSKQYFSAEPNEHDVSTEYKVMHYFRVYALISCVCIVTAMISTLAGQFAGCNARRDLHERLLKAIMSKSLHFFQVTPIGRLMNRFSNDMAIIDKKIAATSQRLLQFALLCVCAILINVSITPWFMILTLPICAAYYAIQKFYRCSSRELQRIENSTNAPVISHLSETIQGVTTIRAYNQESRFTEILFKRLEANTIATTMLNTSNRWLGISLDYLGGVIVFVAIITALVASHFSCSSTTVANNRTPQNVNNMEATATSMRPTSSLVGLAINYTLLMPIYLNWVVKLLADMEMYIGSVERFAFYAEPMTTANTRKQMAAQPTLLSADATVSNSVIKTENDKGETSNTVTDVKTANDGQQQQQHKQLELTKQQQQEPQLRGECHIDVLRNSIERSSATSGVEQDGTNGSGNGKRYKSVPISWPQRCDISFENVSLRYEGCRYDVIKNLTLHITAGQRLGICGRTGCGKSSLALSLFGAGIMQTTSGRIRIDDVDIGEIHPDEIRARLSLISQDVHLFSASIRENLDPPGYYSDLALWNCLEMAQLKQFVQQQMPHGLDTKIMDNGISFSAGHRQLLCLARAILRGSVCLILDEATSALDSTVEKALLLAAHKAFTGRTIISIAHRLSTILDYDRIIVLENGRIVEDGSPSELLAKAENGVFYTLLHSGSSQQ